MNNGGDMPYEEKRILSHSAGSISGADALETINALTADPEFAAALKKYDMEIPPIPTFRPLAVEHNGDFSGIRFAPPHDHLGEYRVLLLSDHKTLTSTRAQVVTFPYRWMVK